MDLHVKIKTILSFHHIFALWLLQTTGHGNCKAYLALCVACSSIKNIALGVFKLLFDTDTVQEKVAIRWQTTRFSPQVAAESRFH